MKYRGRGRRLRAARFDVTAADDSSAAVRDPEKDVASRSSTSTALLCLNMAAPTWKSCCTDTESNVRGRTAAGNAMQQRLPDPSMPTYLPRTDSQSRRQRARLQRVGIQDVRPTNLGCHSFSHCNIMRDRGLRQAGSVFMCLVAEQQESRRPLLA